jgi:hypothetical protein
MMNLSQQVLKDEKKKKPLEYTSNNVPLGGVI